MNRILILLVVTFSLCLGHPQVVNLEDLNKIKVLNISEELENSSLKLAFYVENDLANLMLEQNESEFGVYANGLKILESSDHDKELKRGFDKIEVTLKPNSSNLRVFWNEHISKGEQSELFLRVLFVYKLDGSYLRIFETKSWNITTKLLPEVNNSFCNFSLSLKSTWGNISENETEVFYKLNIISDSEKSLLINFSVYLNDVLISTFEKEENIKNGSNELFASQNLSTQKISEFLRLSNIFNFKFKIFSKDCAEEIEKSTTFDLVV